MLLSYLCKIVNQLFWISCVNLCMDSYIELKGADQQ